MSEPDILYPAIFVFSMLLIGLGLTVREFSRMKRSVDQKYGQHRPVSDSQTEEYRAPVAKVSNF